MSILTQLNSPFLYIVCGAIILFIAAVSLFFLIRAYRAGKAMGIDTTKMKRVIAASATFTGSSPCPAAWARPGPGCGCL